MRFIAFVLVLIFVVGAASADERAWDAYVDGAFLDAAALAETRTGERALAARALIAAAVTGESNDIDGLIARAERNARAALAEGEDGVEARLQLALALGLKGRRAPLGEVLRHGYAREGRALLDAALARDPQSAWAHALDGAWHLEVVRRGGVAGARIYGASSARGIAAFERARALAPDDAVIAYQYAVALLELDGKRHGAKAAVLLDAARACRRGDAFEAAIGAEAHRIAGVLARHGADVAARSATGRLG